jgi:microcystin-dependent protein
MSDATARRGFLAKGFAALSGFAFMSTFFHSTSRGADAADVGLRAGGRPLLGEIALVPYRVAPAGWAFCDGQLLSIRSNKSLFGLLGTTYGGDGLTTFALPDLRGRVPIGSGEGSGLSRKNLGEHGGSETHALTLDELPVHNHVLMASDAIGARSEPKDSLIARDAAGISQFGSAHPAAMAECAIQPAGGGIPHHIMPPYLALNYIISLNGILPDQGPDAIV